MRMKILEDIKEMLEDELREVKKRGTHTPAEYEFIHTAVKTIGEIMDICERNKTDHMDSDYYGKYSGRNDTMPMRMMRGNSGSRYYSGDSSKHRVIRELEEMLDQAGTEYEKETIRSCIDKLSR